MKYDAIVIGSGQGGGPLTHKLADAGWKVALIEKEFLGGSCVNYGCTPTKTMVASARIAHYARRAADFGIETGVLKIDMPKIVERKNNMVKAWRGGQEKQAAKRDNVTVINGHGRLTGPHSVEVNGEIIESDKIILNTGTRPRIPAIPGLDSVEYLTNRNVMDLQAVPEHLIVLGGNYIGLEFGQIYRRLGAEVTVIEMAERIIPREDEDVSEALQNALENEGMVFKTGSQASQVQSETGAIRVQIENGSGQKEEISGSHLLVATGRVPNTDDLGLEKAGVMVNTYGHVEVNEFLETNVPGIWAIGDIKGGPAFTNVSYDDFLKLYEFFVNGEKQSIAGRLVPYALFTDPEMGRVGLSEQEARQQGYRLKIGKIPMSRVARAIERDETAGLMKVVIDAETDQILGATILGPEGGELVQIFMAMILAGAKWQILKRTVYVHPSLAEGFYSLMESVKEV